MEFFNSLFYFIIVLGILVFVHELGHFLAARLTKMRAEIFSIGMGKRLIGWNRITGFSTGDLPKDWDGGDHTDYRLSLLPIGGYVKITGMVDESMDNDEMHSEPKNYEFRSKNALQKAFVLSAGVLMNLLLAILIFSWLTYSKGETKLKTTEIAYVAKNSLASEIGFQNNDIVVAIDNKKVNNWTEVIDGIVISNLGKDKNIIVNRNGSQISLKLKNNKVLDVLSNNESLGISPKGNVVVLSDIYSLEPAGEAGLMSNDTVISANGNNIVSVKQFIDIISNSKKNPVELLIARETGDTVLTVTPSDKGKIGAGLFEISKGKFEVVSFGIGESITIGFDKTIQYIDLIITSIGQIFKGNIAFENAVGGPIMIAKQSAESAERGFESFLVFIAALSLSLALLNILPITALDGGHLIIVLIEAIYRKELPLKVKMAIQNIGMLLLLTLMVIIVIFDVLR
ncbi:MAG: RIP metalloprotease RseP [Candidatus Kapaibacterium sp.]